MEAIKALQPRGEEGRLHFFTTVRLLLQGCRATENLFLFLRLFSSLTQIEEFGIDIQAFWNSTFIMCLTQRAVQSCAMSGWNCLCLNFKYGHSSSLLSMFAAPSLLRGTLGWLTISGYSQFKLLTICDILRENFVPP